MILDREVELLANAVPHLITASQQTLQDYLYGHLSQCVLSAVFSINSHANAERNVVKRYAAYANLNPRYRQERGTMLSKANQQSLDLFCKDIEEVGAKTFAEEVVQNRQRTSTRSGILKAEAAYHFASVLVKHDVLCMQDIDKVMENLSFEKEIQGIRGQGSGVSLCYFYMLVSNDMLIKPDRMIIRFLEGVLGRPIKCNEPQKLLTATVEMIQSRYPGLTPRLLDNYIWSRERNKNLHQKIA